MKLIMTVSSIKRWKGQLCPPSPLPLLPFLSLLLSRLTPPLSHFPFRDTDWQMAFCYCTGISGSWSDAQTVTSLIYKDDVSAFFIALRFVCKDHCSCSAIPPFRWSDSLFPWLIHRDQDPSLLPLPLPLIALSPFSLSQSRLQSQCPSLPLHSIIESPQFRAFFLRVSSLSVFGILFISEIQWQNCGRFGSSFYRWAIQWIHQWTICRLTRMTSIIMWSIITIDSRSDPPILPLIRTTLRHSSIFSFTFIRHHR